MRVAGNPASSSAPPFSRFLPERAAARLPFPSLPPHPVPSLAASFLLSCHGWVSTCLAPSVADGRILPAARSLARSLRRRRRRKDPSLPLLHFRLAVLHSAAAAAASEAPEMPHIAHSLRGASGGAGRVRRQGAKLGEKKRNEGEEGRGVVSSPCPRVLWTTVLIVHSPKGGGWGAGRVEKGSLRTLTREPDLVGSRVGSAPHAAAAAPP